MTQTLNTIEYGRIRIVEKVDRRLDTFLGLDLIGEWEFWSLCDKYGEIVAVYVGEDDEKVNAYTGNMPCDNYGLCAGTACPNYFKCHG